MYPVYCGMEDTTGANQFGLKSDYKQSIHRLIQRFLEIPEVVIHLIPHVLGFRGRCGGKMIIPLCGKLKKIL